MRGRNGSDELYIFMSAAYIIMIIINAFVRSRIFSAIILAWFILTVFRFFSKDIYRRQNENAKFVTFLNHIKNKNFKRDPYAVKTKKDSKLKRKIKMYKTMFKDRKTHVFKKCPPAMTDQGYLRGLRLWRDDGFLNRCGSQILLI